METGPTGRTDPARRLSSQARQRLGPTRAHPRRNRFTRAGKTSKPQQLLHLPVGGNVRLPPDRSFLSPGGPSRSTTSSDGRAATATITSSGEQEILSLLFPRLFYPLSLLRVGRRQQVELGRRPGLCYLDLPSHRKGRVVAPRHQHGPGHAAVTVDVMRRMTPQPLG